MKLHQIFPALVMGLVALPMHFAMAQTSVLQEATLTGSRDAPLAINTEAQLAVSVDSKEFNPRGFFTIRQDYRKCVSPLCGGYFVKQVNRRLTRCADGSRQPECYVATINWRALGLNPVTAVKPSAFNEPLPLLLRGRIRPQEFKGFGNLGKFVVKEAYRALGKFNTASLYVGLQDNGIVCITSPCFSTDQYVLNRKRLRAVSGVNLSEVEASDEAIKRAAMILVDGGVLVAAGKNVPTDEQAREGLDFVANQFFLPLFRPRR